MRVKYTGDYYKVILSKDVEYEVLSIEAGPFGEGYRIDLPELGDDGLFFSGDFEVVDDSGRDELMASAALRERRGRGNEPS